MVSHTRLYVVVLATLAFASDAAFVPSCGQLAGGISCALPNPEQYLNITLRAINAKNLAFTDVKVISVRTQVVAGLVYYIKIETTLEQKKQECNISIWSRPWLSGNDSFQVTQFECTVMTTARPSQNSARTSESSKTTERGPTRTTTNMQIPGGISAELPNPQQFLWMANKAVQISNSRLTNIQVKSARRQVVNGVKYFLELRSKVEQQIRNCSVQIWIRDLPTGNTDFQVTASSC